MIRKCNFRDLLWMWRADIVALQETKLSSPDVRLKIPGYYDYWSFYENCPTTSCQSGVACLTRIKPINVIRTFADPDFDMQGRLLILEFHYLFVVNVYVPNSQDEISGKNNMVSVKRREYREAFDRHLFTTLTTLNEDKPVIVCGDFNASVAAIDMAEHSSWQRGASGFAKEANDRLRRLTYSGFTDTYRYLHPKEPRAYTHWSLRDKNRDTGLGRRLDYFFVSDDLASKIKRAKICKDVYGSDHAPIYLDIDMHVPVIRHEKRIGLTYDDLLERERTKAYFQSLATADLGSAWDTVDWDRARKHLRQMQRSLAIAARDYDTEKIRHWQYRIVVSLDAKLLAVRSVTSRGSTPGVDHTAWKSSNDKMHAAISLTSKNYHAKPAIMVRRLNGGKMRNIHIDTYYDRAMQALYGYSLAPIAETWADDKSFANRRHRSTMDADYYIRRIYSGSDAPMWAYKTDVMKCYESLSHEWIRAHIPLAERVMDEFLEAGYFFSDRYYDPQQGIGIGCRLSVYLAGMALDGLQDYIYMRLNPGKCEGEIDYDNGHMVRYADDILVSARDMDTALRIGRIITDFMRERGLLLSQKKTEVIYVPSGFDFLGRTYNKYGDNLISSPSADAVANFKNRIDAYISDYEGSQERLITNLNKKIVGFVTYHKMTDAYDSFHELDYYIRARLFLLCEMRYPSFSRNRIMKEFWLLDDKRRPNFVLRNAPYIALIFMSDTIATSFLPIPLTLNPYIDYDRIDKLTGSSAMVNVIGKYKRIWNRQDGMCAICAGRIFADDDRELIETAPDDKCFTQRMSYIHSRCKNIELGVDDTYEEMPCPAKHSDSSLKLAMELSQDAEEDIEDSPLYNFFRDAVDSNITLSLEEIESLCKRPLGEMSCTRDYWLDSDVNKLSHCWLDNGYVVRKVSTSGGVSVTFHKYNFTGETARVYIPDLLLHGEVPVRMKLRIEAMLKYEFERNGLVW